MTYQKEEMIGSGGFGLVWKAKMRIGDSDETVAVKELAQIDPKTLSRFRKEIQVLLSHEHRNIVPILAQDLALDPPYFAMPLAVGNLRFLLDWCRRRERVRDHLFSGILDGVAYLHTQGLVHRDLKPENVLLFEASEFHRWPIFDGAFDYYVPKVSDFGIVRDQKTSSSGITSGPIGTWAYAAPEQFHDPKVGPEADVYSLGKIMREMLTGNPLAEEDQDLSYLSPGEAYILEKSTRVERASRFLNAVSMRACLHALVSNQDNPALEARDYLDWCLTNGGAISVETLTESLSYHASNENPDVVLSGIPDRLMGTLIGSDDAGFADIACAVIGTLVQQTRKHIKAEGRLDNERRLESAADFLMRLQRHSSEQARVVDSLLGLASIGSGSGVYAPRYCLLSLLVVLNQMADQGQAEKAVKVLQGHSWVLSEIFGYFDRSAFREAYHELSDSVLDTLAEPELDAVDDADPSDQN